MKDWKYQFDLQLMRFPSATAPLADLIILKLWMHLKTAVLQLIWASNQDELLWKNGTSHQISTSFVCLLTHRNKNAELKTYRIKVLSIPSSLSIQPTRWIFNNNIFRWKHRLWICSKVIERVFFHGMWNSFEKFQ